MKSWGLANYIASNKKWRLTTIRIWSTANEEMHTLRCTNIYNESVQATLSFPNSASPCALYIYSALPLHALWRGSTLLKARINPNWSKWALWDGGATALFFVEKLRHASRTWGYSWLFPAIRSELAANSARREPFAMSLGSWAAHIRSYWMPSTVGFPKAWTWPTWKMPTSGPDNLWFISLMSLIKILPLEHVEKKETSKQNHLEYAGMVRTISWNSVEPAYFFSVFVIPKYIAGIFIVWKWVTWLLEMSMTCS